MIQRTLQAIFCDDIRQEVSGKHTLVGVYSGGLFVQNFPAMIASLSIFVRFMTAAKSTPESLSVRVVKGDQVIHEFAVPGSDLKRIKESAPAGSSEENIQTMQFMIGLNQLPFEGDSALHVEALTDEGTYMSTPLTIGQMPVQGSAAHA